MLVFFTRWFGRSGLRWVLCFTLNVLVSPSVLLQSWFSALSEWIADCSNGCSSCTLDVTSSCSWGGMTLTECVTFWQDFQFDWHRPSIDAPKSIDSYRFILMDVFCMLFGFGIRVELNDCWVCSSTVKVVWKWYQHHAESWNSHEVAKLSLFGIL